MKHFRLSPFTFRLVIPKKNFRLSPFTFRLATPKKNFRLSPFAFRLVPPVFMFILAFFSSCTTQKQLTYLQDIDQSGPNNFYNLARPEYHLQKQDILYVNLSTDNSEMSALLEGTNSNSQSINMTMGAAYLRGYTMDDSGSIEIPAIGKVEVLGKTLEEVNKAVQEKASVLLKDVTVTIKLLSYKFSVLGEVNNPGNFQIFDTQMTLLDALGMAGDMTNYGDRTNILVIRSEKKGLHTYRINLKKKDLLTSQAYFILPNDVVIVEPRKVKLISINAPTVSLFFSTIFSTISLTLLILNTTK